MKLVCPECKNDVNLSLFPDLAPEHVLECDVCGITLLVNEMSGEDVKTEVIDEGK